MSNPVQLYCWHFMAYPHLPADFDETYDTGWVTVPNSLWDKDKSRGLYQHNGDGVRRRQEGPLIANLVSRDLHALFPRYVELMTVPAAPTRCDSACSSRPNGETKPREDSSNGPTGFSAASGR